MIHSLYVCTSPVARAQIVGICSSCPILWIALVLPGVFLLLSRLLADNKHILCWGASLIGLVHSHSPIFATDLCSSQSEMVKMVSKGTMLCSCRSEVHF
jgi:hypothetical protein